MITREDLLECLFEGVDALKGLPKHIKATMTDKRMLNVAHKESTVEVHPAKGFNDVHDSVEKASDSMHHIVVKKGGKVIGSVHPRSGEYGATHQIHHSDQEGPLHVFGSNPADKRTKHSNSDATHAINRLFEKHGGYGKDVELHHYSVKRPF